MKSIKTGLYIISTPIGNLDDITLRAIEILKNSDIILCEDTRRSLRLLNHLKIKKKLISYYKFNEKKKLSYIIEHLNEGKILSLISDAGTPTISDPGAMLIRECVKNKINIYPIPGPSSVITAMSVSGFDEKFIFFGFLPKTEYQLEKTLLSLKDLDFTQIFFISGKKIDFYLNKMKDYFSGREILICRELTKAHETFYRGTVDQLNLFETELKGELTIVISNIKEKKKYIDQEEIKKKARILLKKYSLKDTVDLILENKEIERKKVYKICLSLKK